MKRRIMFMICALCCLLMLTGCACEHVWTEADCVTAKTCSLCQVTQGEPLGHTWAEADCVAAKTCTVCHATEGNPLGHTWMEASCVTVKTCSVCQATEGERLAHAPGPWEECVDVVAATVSRTQHCTVCNEQTGEETEPLSTMLVDDRFLFTPNAFMERMALLAEGKLEDFSYEFVTNPALIARVSVGGNEHIVQFFRHDATACKGIDRDAAVVWCVNLTVVGDANADLQRCFLMACDPKLDQDAASELDGKLVSALLAAARKGEIAAYHWHNKVLYEMLFYPEGTLAPSAMYLIDVYASDFR